MRSHKSKIQIIEFKNVSFKYGENDVIQNFSMQIKKGDMLGISAISGKGKTTLLNLLLGLIDPDTGEISINGRLTDKIVRQNHWNDIAYIKQQPFLIHDTVTRNITLDEVVDEQKLHDAIRSSGLEKFINEQFDSYNFIVEENGKNISGGQRQRIVLARAFYKEFDMLVLDEPFKELDFDAEIKILKYLQGLVADGKIVILISHDQKSLSYCNKIISLDDK
jgi:ABC-type multidrug transport system fused ATPase/permease subunit